MDTTDPVFQRGVRPSISELTKDVAACSGMIEHPDMQDSLSNKEQSQPAIYFLDGTLVKSAPLSRSLYKSQLLLSSTIDNLFLTHGERQILFVTLTFPDPLNSTRETQRRLNSWMNKIRQRYSHYIWVLQPQASGAIHYHLLMPVNFDAHADTNLEPWSYRSEYTDADRLNAMNAKLRIESDWWTQKASGFGRVEVAPVYSNGEAVRKYLSRQDWRTWHWPFIETKHVKFWGCSKSARSGTVKFSWNTPGGRLSREKLQEWAQQQGCQTYEDLPRVIGKNWGYFFHYHLTRQRAQL